jgi:hypothetical protein
VQLAQGPVAKGLLVATAEQLGVLFHEERLHQVLSVDGKFRGPNLKMTGWLRAVGQSNLEKWAGVLPRPRSEGVKKKHVTSDSHGFEHIDPQTRVLNYCFQ